MSKNLVSKILGSYQKSWTAPAGVTSVSVTVLDKFDKLVNMGSTHAAALKSNGSVWCWGLGTSGQLGDNSITSKSSPVAVTGGHSFVQIYANNIFTTALKADGTVWSWGSNTNGQLGDNTVASKSSPVAVTGGHSFINISASGTVGIALKADGSAWTWGNNANGELGDNTIVNKSSPVAVVGGHSFIQTSVMVDVVAALKADGSAWCWGTGTSGELGDNNLVTSYKKSSPVAVVGGHSFIQVDAGAAFCAALKADGSVWTWGANSSGELGDNSIVNKSSPVAVVGGHSFIQVALGYSHAAALKSDGSVWTWGNNTSGALGHSTGGTSHRSSPVAIVGGHSFIQIAAENTTSMALKADGSIYTWGLGTSGQLGDSSIVSKSSPVPVVGGHLFEAGIKFSNKRTFTVVPGTTYSLNAFITNINTNIMTSNAGNNVYLVLEYYA